VEIEGTDSFLKRNLVADGTFDFLLLEEGKGVSDSAKAM
jgi:hypothetical protein